jgi:hypothetical protein
MLGIDPARADGYDAAMGDVINLRRARKQKARTAKEAEAAARRAAFGRKKADKRREEAERRRAETELDGKKREE